MAAPPKGESSQLFQPLALSGGKIRLQHRVVMAPMTRNRGVPLSEGTPDAPNRTWLADEVVAKYYEQRASPGGLLITEGIPPSIEAGAMPQVPGLFDASQEPGWKLVTAAVHGKGGYIFAQLWHAGRAAIPQMSGLPTVSASATPWDDDETYPFRTPFTKEKIKYRDFPPIELTKEHIKKTIGDYVDAARRVMAVGFDGVEINGGNGNLPDQFLHSNINTRTDEYGGSPENRSRFVLELVEALASAIGVSNVGIRLEPTGIYNHTRGAERVETWSYLCKELASRFPGLSYVHFIEPRFDRIDSEKEKDGFYKSWKSDVPIGNDHFRKLLGSIPVISCGGWDDQTSWGVLEDGKYDALVYARWFTSNPDLPERLKKERALSPFDRSRFYGGWDGREKGYTTFPTWDELEEKPTATVVN